MIAVTGATGEIGRRVVAGLDDPILITRRPHGEARLAAGYGDFDGMRAAFTGVETVFLIPAGESADRVQQHKTAVDAAVAAGVARIVYLSFFNAAPDATFTLARDHWATEEHIRASGVTWTFLRMNLYMDFIPGMAVDGVIRGPAGDGRVSAILRDDVAGAAVAVLRAPRDGETFDLTGPSAFSLAEVAERLGAEYVDETDEEAYASRASYNAPHWEVAGWVSSYQAIRDGSLAHVSDDVRELIGREPTSLQAFLGR
ncbi:NAD(P)H-binding protein [Solirubrobacter taibaiensis]|nr:NAD(P)H-binding protein [Solirubrobacter taibaiensis]